MMLEQLQAVFIHLFYIWHSLLFMIRNHKMLVYFDEPLRDVPAGNSAALIAVPDHAWGLCMNKRRPLTLGLHVYTSWLGSGLTGRLALCVRSVWMRVRTQVP